jgi:putative ABC transport system permease protein
LGRSVSYALGPELKRRYPEIEASCRVWPWHRSLVKYQDKKFDEYSFYLTDPTFFTMFTFPFVKGNAEIALADLNSIVITEETAHRYFDEEDPIGKILHVASHNTDFTVTGVIQNIPSNSHLQFNMVARVEYLGEDRIGRWEEWVAPSYVLLESGANEEDVEEKIAGIYEEHLDCAHFDMWAGRIVSILAVGGLLDVKGRSEAQQALHTGRLYWQPAPGCRRFRWESPVRRNRRDRLFPE